MLVKLSSSVYYLVQDPPCWVFAASLSLTHRTEYRHQNMPVQEINTQLNHFCILKFYSMQPQLLQLMKVKLVLHHQPMYISLCMPDQHCWSLNRNHKFSTIGNNCCPIHKPISSCDKLHRLSVTYCYIQLSRKSNKVTNQDTGQAQARCQGNIISSFNYS